ncbi:hypothetical protein GYA93_17850 [Gordonia desulfuricans]|uniref:Uncharacterized protein n=1 Tax=Gordonia desulfuricans TaxID=89051 RepID=A0A7K3LV32_9ACTN|nr:hypothetical protein [Gordonia desulfuricans]NDK91427.1 hypothetical protein [Gordonia desulfuricans]
MTNQNQPTWARVRHGAGVALPTKGTDPDTGREVMGLIPTAVPISLEYVGPRTVHGPNGAHRVQVWIVPAEAWSEGDSVEIGPVPDGVIVEYEIPRPLVQHGVDTEAVAS